VRAAIIVLTAMITALAPLPESKCAMLYKRGRSTSLLAQLRRNCEPIERVDCR
jgi:hypothetical protein